MCTSNTLIFVLDDHLYIVYKYVYDEYYYGIVFGLALASTQPAYGHKETRQKTSGEKDAMSGEWLVCMSTTSFSEESHQHSVYWKN